MIALSIITRRLKDGKTYDDFRRAWYHTTGFGTGSKLYSAIDVFDPRQIIVVGFMTIPPDRDPMEILRIDVKERLENPLEDVIEPEIGRVYGILVSEDDFSAEGTNAYRPASIDGEETDFGEISQALNLAQRLIATAFAERDEARSRV